MFDISDHGGPYAGGKKVKWSQGQLTTGTSTFTVSLGFEPRIIYLRQFYSGNIYYFRTFWKDAPGYLSRDILWHAIDVSTNTHNNYSKSSANTTTNADGFTSVSIMTGAGYPIDYIAYGGDLPF